MVCRVAGSIYLHGPIVAAREILRAVNPGEGDWAVSS